MDGKLYLVSSCFLNHPNSQMWLGILHHYWSIKDAWCLFIWASSTNMNFNGRDKIVSNLMQVFLKAKILLMKNSILVAFEYCNMMTSSCLNWILHMLWLHLVTSWMHEILFTHTAPSICEGYHFIEGVTFQIVQGTCSMVFLTIF